MSTCNVLLVDDEKDFRKTLEKRLIKRKLNVMGVDSGEESIEMLGRELIDVVVLDMRMQGMDGIETLKRIKKLYPRIEIILLTGHASVEAAVSGMELGAFDYLMKPMDIDDLLYKIQDAYKRKSIQEQKLRDRDRFIDK